MDLIFELKNTETPAIREGAKTGQKKYMLELRIAGTWFGSWWFVGTDDEIETQKSMIADSIRSAKLTTKGGKDV